MNAISNNDLLKCKLGLLKQFESVNKSLNLIEISLKNSELDWCDLSNSGESCAQNYCRINTQLIESFECFNKSIDNNKQFKCFWPKCGIFLWNQNYEF